MAKLKLVALTGLDEIPTGEPVKVATGDAFTVDKVIGEDFIERRYARLQSDDAPDKPVAAA